MRRFLEKVRRGVSRNTAKELMALQLDLQHSQSETVKLQKELKSLQSKLQHSESDNLKLQDELESLKGELREYSSREDLLYDQLYELGDLKQKAEKQEKLLDLIGIGITDTVINTIEQKLKAGLSGGELYGMFSSVDEGPWEPCPCLVSACREILGDTEIHHLFPEEDNLGMFEELDPYEEMDWREKHAFGEIVNSHFSGMYEFCDYEIDMESEAYLDYRKRLYEKAVMRLSKTFPLEMFASNPSFFLSK